MTYVNICQECKESFETNRKNKHFCSKECRYKHIGNKVSQVRKTDEFQQKMKEQNLEKYGVEHPMQVKEIKDKVIRTQKEKYGELPLLKVKPNYEQRYENIKRSFQKKYGVDNPFKLKEFQTKALNTKQSIYGKNPFTFGSREFEDNMNSKYGESWKAEIINRSQNNGFGMVSKTNREWQQLLKEATGVEFTLEKDSCNVVGRYSYDLRYKDLLIEINPWISHNTAISYAYKTGRQTENKPIAKDYHLNRWLNARENGCQLLSYFDWYDKDKFIDIVKSKLGKLPNKCYARQTILKEISQREANIFLNAYHIQGKMSKQTVCLGLFFKDELIQIMTFGKPRFDKSYTWELLRLCSKKDWLVVGGKSKLIGYFLDNYAGSVMSYNNNNISTTDGKVIPNFGLWFNPKSKKTFNNSTLLAKGASRLIGDVNFSKYPQQTSNEEIMLAEGYLPFYDCGSCKEVIRN